MNYFIYNKKVMVGKLLEQTDKDAYLLAGNRVYKVPRSNIYTTAVEAYSQLPLL